MSCRSHWSPLLLAVTLGFACAGSEAPEGPSVDGSPFLTATLDGMPWSPDPGDIDAYVAGQGILWARRNAADADRTEILQINFTPPTAFQLGSYDLRGDAMGAGQFSIWFGASGESPDSLAWYGVFAFEGEDRRTHLLRYVRGQFRVRYISIDP